MLILLVPIIYIYIYNIIYIYIEAGLIFTFFLAEGIHQIRYKINEEKIKKVARKVLEKRRIHNDIKLQLTEGTLIKTFGEYLSTQSAEAQERYGNICSIKTCYRAITSLREEIERSKTST